MRQRAAAGEQHGITKAYTAFPIKMVWSLSDNALSAATWTLFDVFQGKLRARHNNAIITTTGRRCPVVCSLGGMKHRRRITKTLSADWLQPPRNETLRETRFQTENWRCWYSVKHWTTERSVSWTGPAPRRYRPIMFLVVCLFVC